MITIHLANSVELHQADALVRRVYGAQGLGDHGLHGEGDTFVVCNGCHMVGTLSLVVDGPQGVPADDMFKDTLDELRASGARLCELTRFVLETQSPSAKLLHDLFHALHRHGVANYDCTDLIIQADPRHCFFYRRRLGFKPLGPVVWYPQFNTQGQLLRIHVSELSRHFEPQLHNHNPTHNEQERRFRRVG